MARLFPWRHLLLGQGDLFGALAVCSPTFTQRFGPVTTRGEAPAEPCPVASYGAEAQPQVLSLEVRGGPLSAVAQPISTTTPFRGDLDGVRTQLRGRTEPRCTKCWLSGSIGIGRGCRFGPRFERSDDQSSWFGPVASAEWLLSATRLAEAAASLARGRRRSASAAKGQAPVGQQRVPEEQRRSARS
jgi:hypothetical protein